MEEKGGASDELLGGPRSEFKVLAGEKRGRPGGDERPELDPKRLKMKDHESVFLSEAMTSKEAVNPVHSPIDLNANLSATSNVAFNDAAANDWGKSPFSLFKKSDMDQNVNRVVSKGCALDLNAEGHCNMAIVEYDANKVRGDVKPVDDSDCGSSIGPVEEKDPMKVWREMKQNGFLSASHGGVPMPKPRGRKKQSDGMKRKMELAKKEQVDRFAKMAAPSGLLNDLNPGIINHVRNKRQVHSIIEALVRSEKDGNDHSCAKEGDQGKKAATDSSERKDLTPLNYIFQEPGSLYPLVDRGHSYGLPTLDINSFSLHSQLTGVDNSSSMVDARGSGSSKALVNLERGDDVLALKLSTAIPSDNNNNASSLSNEEPVDSSTVDSLSVKAARVASQWLELLHLDIKGRLAALHRSKKRVRAVIQTELPFLFSKEFPSTKENFKPSAAGHPPNLAEAHRAKWNTLFDQMEQTLSEEEKQMEGWLKQIKEMQYHCERGLFKYNGVPNPFEIDRSLQKADTSERDLALRAAAASIYSTCNFLMSKENAPCC